MNDASASSGPRRRAIVLIPGVRREERFFRRDTLINNLETVETFPLRRGEAVEVAGEVGIRLTARPLRSASAPQGPDLDVFEAHWADMVPEQAELGPWQKLGSGWTCSPTGCSAGGPGERSPCRATSRSG